MDKIEVFYQPEGRLRMTMGDRSYVEVKPAWAAPLSQTGKYLVLLDGKDREIILIPDPIKELKPETWSLLQKELQRRYLSVRIDKILSTKTIFGSTYWTVMTERGERDFVTQSLQENAQWLSPEHLLVIDVDGNRFELPDINALDEESKNQLFMTV